MKKILIILLVFVLLFSACSTEQKITADKNNSVKPSSKQKVSLVVKPDKTRYIQSNGITADTIQKKIDTSKGKANLHLVQIHGLKDKDLERKINSAIEENINNLVQNLVDSSNEKPHGFYSMLELSANNLISIVVDSDYSGFREGMLYSLRDGKRLYLKDLFTEGTDYVSLLNNKVIEKILAGYQEESEFLREPFSTIAPDQSFCINQTSLNLMFRKGEAGFAIDYVINIPLEEIYDYVDLLDKQEGLDENIYERTGCIVKYNNIFINEIQELVQSSGRNIVLNYPVISGMADPDIEKRVNKIIRDGIDELQQSYYASDSDFSTPDGETSRNITVHVSFNCYDYIGITWQSFRYTSENERPKLLLHSYTIDLKTGEIVNPKDILNNYANSNEAFKTAFTKKVLATFKSSWDDVNIDNIEKLGTDAAYSFIVDNSTIYFYGLSFTDEPRIAVYLKENLISPYPVSTDAALYTDLAAPPESFFE